MNEIIVAFIALLNYIIIACDAMTDAAVDRRVGWWEFHIPKWVRFFMPQIIILALLLITGIFEANKLNAIAFIGYISVGWLIWNLVYIWNPLSDQD